MKNKLYLALAPILAAVLVYALFFRASDEDRIRQKLAALEVAMKSGGSQSDAAARPLRIQKAFASVFTPRVHADIPGSRPATRPAKSWRRWPRPPQLRSTASTSPSTRSTWRSIPARSRRARTSTRWRR